MSEERPERRFRSLFISDIHLGSLQNVQVRAFRVLLSVFVRGRVHLHFDSPEEVVEALKSARFADARVHRSVELAEDGRRSAVAVVHGFIGNQGDAWTVTSAYLDRFVEEQRLLTAEAAEHSDEEAAYARRMEQVGRRVAELQLALASRDDWAGHFSVVEESRIRMTPLPR